MHIRPDYRPTWLCIYKCKTCHGIVHLSFEQFPIKAETVFSKLNHYLAQEIAFVFCIHQISYDSSRRHKWLHIIQSFELCERKECKELRMFDNCIEREAKDTIRAERV